MTTLIKATDLHRILTAAQAHAAGAASSTAMLHAVRLEAGDDTVLAIGTDRYTLGVSRAEVLATTSQSYPAALARAIVNFPGVAGIDNAAFDFTASLPDVVKLTRTARTTKKELNSRLVSLSVTDSVLTAAFSTGETLELKDSTDNQGQFPGWRRLLEHDREPTPRDVTGFNPAYLARFAKAGEGDLRLFSFDDDHGRAQKPLGVAVGDDFIGLVMPVKLPGADAPQAQWPPAWWIGQS